MNSIRSRLGSTVLAAMFAFALAACGGPNTGAQNCNGEPCLDGSSDIPGTVDQPAMCGEQSNCDEPEDPSGGGGTVTPPPPTYSIATFDSYGGFEHGTSPVASGWSLTGCAWGNGAAATPDAKVSGLRGLALSKFGCRAESVRVEMPSNAWTLNLRYEGNIWGRPCPSTGCARVTVSWFDSAGVRVVGTPPTYPYATSNWVIFNVVAARPYNATSASVTYESLVPDGQGVFVDDVRLSVQ